LRCKTALLHYGQFQRDNGFPYFFYVQEKPISLIFLHIAGAVCLLLWGTRMVRMGFSRAYGTSLRRIIAAGTGNRFTSFLSGATVTALLQSSTATAFILISFAKKRMIGLSAALAVVIGADVSTTLVAQVMTFNLSWLSPALLVIGFAVHTFYEKGGRWRHIARILIGLGLMLLALSLIRAASAPIKSSATLPFILGPLEKDPAFAIIIAAIITYVIHSSLATVLLFASLTSNHIVDLQLGMLLVLGANIGGAMVPFIATYKDGAQARRITMANLLMRITMVIIAAPFLTTVVKLLSDTGVEIPRQLVHFHTGFNIALAIVFLPLINQLAKLMTKFIPDEPVGIDPAQPLYLDERALDSPVMALAGAARETLRIAEIVEDMLEKTIIAFESGTEKQVEQIRRSDNQVDKLYKAVKLYLTRLSQESLDPKEADRYIQILTFTTNLEHIGDIIDNSMMEMALKKIKKKEEFSEEGFREIKNFASQVQANMKLAQTIFMSEDPKLAAQLVEGKQSIRVAADATSEQHFKRLQSGRTASIATSALHLDIIRDYRRINSYATRVAYAILENHEKHRAARKEV
jgi:phosphate:Na+ symporter